ncbi:MAG: LTA synthase family protein [Clostridia bacterium]|nr:LTA synthase family protein [Clostridia bacterium]
MKKQKRERPILWMSLCILALFIGFAAFFAAIWYIRTYGNVGFDSILYTFFSQVSGVQSTLVYEYLLWGLAPSVLLTAFTSFIIFRTPKKERYIKLKSGKEIVVYPFTRKVSRIIALCLAVVLVLVATFASRLSRFLYFCVQNTGIFVTDYVSPDDVKIKFPKEKRNLIYIYLESMETTYMSAEHGGAREKEIVPELYALANENINFSHNEKMGGFYAVSGGSWTAASMVAQTSGIPLKPPAILAKDHFGKDLFLPGVTTITDILKDEGYYQTLMVGSDAAFANRDRYYKQHGIDKIYDVYTAKQDGIIGEDYWVWWGMEDSRLYDYAKLELPKIAEREEPFVFNMLTVDTHHIDGYLCSECTRENTEQYDNVLSCASRQLYGFIEWLKTQPFYENTTIVVTGDHLSMNNEYFLRTVDEDFDRRVYNCIINSAVTPKNTKNRTFTAMDMFPTTLAALGCDIKGERLGLGTNLFSDKKTLAEEMGLETFEKEMIKSSKYYVTDFMF